VIFLVIMICIYFICFFLFDFKIILLSLF